MCDSQLYGVKNVQTHYNGKKHKKKLEDDKVKIFIVFDVKKAFDTLVLADFFYVFMLKAMLAFKILV